MAAKGAIGALVGLMPKGDESEGAADKGLEDAGMAKFVDLAQEAFPDQDMTEDRVMALKEFVKACYEREEE